MDARSLGPRPGDFSQVARPLTLERHREDVPFRRRCRDPPRVNTTEKWILEPNSGGWFHPVHIHLVDVQILRRNSGPVFPDEQGWKDVAHVGANEELELLMTFHAPEAIDPTQSPLGTYVMHCHDLVHEDHDMMNRSEIKVARPTRWPLVPPWPRR